MKILVAFAFLIAGISALSTPLDPSRFADERGIAGDVESAIHGVSHAIRDAGLDPYHLEKETSSYALRVPVLFNYEAILEDIMSEGLSTIWIHRLTYSAIRFRLRYDIELPYISFSAGSARANAEIFSNKLDFSASGKIEIRNVRVRGEVKVGLDIFNGPYLRWVTADFALGDINSDAKVIVMGEDVSDDFNDFFGDFVPRTIREHYVPINQQLEHILYAYVLGIL